jgi:hypothetical protein
MSEWQERKAAIEILEAVSFLKKRFQLGNWNSPFCPEDGALHYAFESVMQKEWDDEDSIKYFHKAFFDAYKSFAKLPEFRQNLMALDSQRKQEQLLGASRIAGALHE